VIVLLGGGQTIFPLSDHAHHFWPSVFHDRDLIAAM
jgi:hypothetical protein